MQQRFGGHARRARDLADARDRARDGATLSEPSSDYGNMLDEPTTVFYRPVVFSDDPASGPDYSATGVRGDPTLATRREGRGDPRRDDRGPRRRPAGSSDGAADDRALTTSSSSATAMPAPSPPSRRTMPARACCSSRSSRIPAASPSARPAACGSRDDADAAFALSRRHQCRHHAGAGAARAGRRHGGACRDYARALCRSGRRARLGSRASPANYPLPGYESFGFAYVDELPGFDPANDFPSVRGSPAGARLFEVLRRNVAARPRHRGAPRRARRAPDRRGRRRRRRRRRRPTRFAPARRRARLRRLRGDRRTCSAQSGR